MSSLWFQKIRTPVKSWVWEVWEPSALRVVGSRLRGRRSLCSLDFVPQFPVGSPQPVPPKVAPLSLLARRSLSLSPGLPKSLQNIFSEEPNPQICNHFRLKRRQRQLDPILKSIFFLPFVFLPYLSSEVDAVVSQQ